MSTSVSTAFNSQHAVGWPTGRQNTTPHTRPPTSLGGILVVFDFVLEVAAVELRGAKDGGETLANKINSLWQRTFNALARYKQGIFHGISLV